MSLVSLILLVLIVYIIYYKLITWSHYYNAVLTGKVAIVTGSSSGVGYKIAKDLAARGATVVLACRDASKGRRARESIVSSTKNKKVVYEHLDLSSLDSVRLFVEKFKSSGQRLDILINNATVMKVGRDSTREDLVESFQINHYGPFLLTVLLIPLLKKSGNGRIVNVSSILHRLGMMDLGKLNLGGFQTYCNSKLNNILFTKELAKRLTNSGVTVNSVDPGFVRTKMYSKDAGILARMVYLVQKLFLKSHSEGAQTVLYLVISDECEKVNGKHFSNCRETSVSSYAEDTDLARKLWFCSESEVKLRSEEKLC